MLVLAYNSVVILSFRIAPQCVPILFSYDCESLFSYRYACLGNLEPVFLPCIIALV